MRQHKSAKELLVPRVKVVQDYPTCKFSIGDILILDTTNFTSSMYVDGKGNYITQAETIKYQPLFRQMYWYEERKYPEMPRYVLMDKRIYEITEWTKDMTGEVTPNTSDDNYSVRIAWRFHKPQSVPIDQEELHLYISKAAMSSNIVQEAKSKKITIFKTK